MNKIIVEKDGKQEEIRVHYKKQDDIDFKEAQELTLEEEMASRLGRAVIDAVKQMGE
jgi:hypothetical protein